MTAVLPRSPSVRPGSVRAWILASRPATLSAAIVPVVVGTACAHAAGGFAAGPATAALFGAMLLQIGANFANDVFDYEKGADTAERLGPTRAVQAGLLTPSAVRTGMFVVFALALGLGVYLTAVAGPVIVAIGLASIAAAVAYTGGPYPLGYHGLGEVFVMVFFGFVAVCGTAFVQILEVPDLAVWASVPVGSLATAILVVNNVRDRETDVKAGKRTLVVRFGRRAGELQYVALIALSHAVPIALILLGRLSFWVGIMPLATLPRTVVLARNVFRDRGVALNRTLVGTAQVLLLHGLSFAAAIALSAK